MNTTYIGKFRDAPMINSKHKFETLLSQLMKNLAQNLLWARVEVEEI